MKTHILVIGKKLLIISLLSGCTDFICRPSVTPVYNKELTEQALSNPDGILFDIKCREVIPCQLKE